MCLWQQAACASYNLFYELHLLSKTGSKVTESDSHSHHMNYCPTNLIQEHEKTQKEVKNDTIFQHILRKIFPSEQNTKSFPVLHTFLKKNKMSKQVFLLIAYCCLSIWKQIFVPGTDKKITKSAAEDKHTKTNKQTLKAEYRREMEKKSVYIS